MNDYAKAVLMDSSLNQSPLQSNQNRLTNRLVDFERDEIFSSIITRFEKQVDQYPEQIALKTSEHTFSYQELNKVANQLARAILAQVDINGPVALLFEHDAQVIVALLAVLKAGLSYAALEPEHPHGRLRQILEDLQTNLILTNDQNLSLASQLAQDGQQLINLDELDVTLPNQNLSLPISPDALAAIFFTSGSTGRPKGVKRNHGQILHRAWAETNDYQLVAGDHIAHLFFCSSGASTADIFIALLNGAMLCPYNVKQKGVEGLANWLLEEELSHFHPPITVFRQLLDILSGAKNFPALRTVMLAGQALYKKDVERFRKHFAADCILIHRMAATETSLITRLLIDQHTPITDNVIPVGYPVPDKSVLILDEAGKEVGFGQVGEIAVKSRYLAPSYWRRQELTRKVFLPAADGSQERIYLTGDLGYMQPDGCLFHRGRKDFQLKIRGYRVEITQIEAILYALDSIKQSVVVAQELESGEKRLVAYLVPSDSNRFTVSKIRQTLAEKLPDYMIPTIFVTLNALPLTATGKVDRRALPEPDHNRPELDTPFVPPRTPLEETVARIWVEVLALDSIGIHDNFFELGGHSLLATQIISRVLKVLRVEIPLRTLFEAPTVAQMAQAIVRRQAKIASQEELLELLAEVEALSEEEVDRLLAAEELQGS